MVILLILISMGLLAMSSSSNSGIPDDGDAPHDTKEHQKPSDDTSTDENRDQEHPEKEDGQDITKHQRPSDATSTDENRDPEHPEKEEGQDITKIIVIVCVCALFCIVGVVLFILFRNRAVAVGNIGDDEHIFDTQLDDLGTTIIPRVPTIVEPHYPPSTPNPAVNPVVVESPHIVRHTLTKHPPHNRPLHYLKRPPQPQQPTKGTYSVLTYNTSNEVPRRNIGRNDYFKRCARSDECTNNIKKIIFDSNGDPRHDITCLQEPPIIQVPDFIKGGRYAQAFCQRVQRTYDGVFKVYPDTTTFPKHVAFYACSGGVNTIVSILSQALVPDLQHVRTIGFSYEAMRRHAEESGKLVAFRKYTKNLSGRPILVILAERALFINLHAPHYGQGDTFMAIENYLTEKHNIMSQDFDRVLICGDFNMEITHLNILFYGRILGTYKNPYNTCCRQFDADFNMSDFRSGVYDHMLGYGILFKRNTKFDYLWDGVDASDHNPVMADITYV